MKKLLNKCPFLSLSAARFVLTFVPSTSLNLIPMNASKANKRIKVLPAVSVLAVVLLLLAPQALFAQGWEYFYGEPSYTDEAEAILQTDQTGFLVAGSSQAMSSDLDFDATVLRTDIDGEVIWQKAFDLGFHGFGTDLAKAHEEKVYVLAGFGKADGLSTNDMHLLFFTERGDLLNSFTYGSEDMDELAHAIIPTTDGGYLLAGRQDAQAMAVKVDGSGAQIWAIPYSADGVEVFADVVEVSDGYVFLGKSQTTDSTYNYLLKTDYNGGVIWSHAYSLGSMFNNPQALIQTTDGQLAFVGYTNNHAYLAKVSNDGQSVLWQQSMTDYLESQANDLVELEDGSLVVTGVAALSAADLDVLLLKYDADGNLLLNRPIGSATQSELGMALTATQDGGYAITGNGNLSAIPLPIYDVLVFKSDATGNTLNSYIRGNVFEDTNLNCMQDADEPLLKKWMVRAESADGTFYGYTDENGFYSLLVDTGLYALTVIPPAPYWGGCDNLEYNIVVPEQHDTLVQDFSLHKLISCSWLEVDMSSTAVQACDTVDYVITYRNRGTDVASGAFVDVVLDADLNFIEADLPVSEQTDSLYRFELGDLQPDDEGRFHLRAFTDCAVIEQQAVISSAHIRPDSICLTPGAGWDGSRISVNAWCEGGTTYFSIKNKGLGDMLTPLDFIVIEDEIMGYQSQDQFQLPAQDSLIVTRSSTEGATFRLVADQAPQLPGYSRPNAVVEGCTTGGSFSVGKVLEFPEDEFDPFVSIDAREVVLSLSANAFQEAFPKGYRGDTIAANVDIEYLIAFYNGSDEVIDRVYIRDTISDKLDYTTIQVGASSHPYTYEAYDRGILKFKFNDIALQPGEYGFVKFHIKQQPDLPEGTEIFNRARLSVGYDAPELTAQKRHVIGGSDYTDFVEITTSVWTPELLADIEIYPNPSGGEVVVEVLGEENLMGWHCQLFDLQGRKLATYTFENNRSVLRCGDLPKGTYLVAITNPMGKLVGVGKLSIQKP